MGLSRELYTPTVLYLIFKSIKDKLLSFNYVFDSPIQNGSQLLVCISSQNNGSQRCINSVIKNLVVTFFSVNNELFDRFFNQNKL